MTTQPTAAESCVILARLVRKQREQFEAALDSCRQESRKLAIELIFEHEFTLARVSAITGHMRPTLRVWVNSEIAKRMDDGLTSPTVREH